MNRDGGSLVRDVLVGLLVGLFSGLLGVGGGIILVPLLVLLMHKGQKEAQATSLVVVALGATSGALTYGFSDFVHWESLLFLIPGGLVGTWIGTFLVKRVEARWLQLLFSVLLVATAFRIGLDSWTSPTNFVEGLTIASAIGFAVSGLAMGFLSALLGVGGGIIVIPLLVALFGFPQQLAAGTSLVAMVPLALFGALRLSRSGFTQWFQGLRLGLASIPGAVVGALLALSAEAIVIQVAFAILLLVAAVSMARKALK